MKLEFNPGTRHIENSQRVSVAWIHADAHERDPKLGAKLAAGPEACLLIKNLLVLIHHWNHEADGYPSVAAAHALLVTVQP